MADFVAPVLTAAPAAGAGAATDVAPPLTSALQPKTTTQSLVWKPWSWWRVLTPAERVEAERAAAAARAEGARWERWLYRLVAWLPVWGPAGLLLAAWFYRPYVLSGPEICGFHRMTGLPCPACGLTRSFCFLAHGEWAPAFGFNGLGPPLFAVLSVVLVLGLLRRLKLVYVEFTPPRGLWWMTVGVVLGSYAVRLAAIWTGT